MLTIPQPLTTKQELRNVDRILKLAAPLSPATMDWLVSRLSEVEQRERF